jgi:hypothetical protein
MSVVGHDDLHVYRAIQEGAAFAGFAVDQPAPHCSIGPSVGAADLTVSGTSEISMRNQFRAWRKFMMAGVPQRPTDWA